MRVAFVAYREIFNKPSEHLEVFPFSSDLDACENFLDGLRAIGNKDTPEDLANGLATALSLEWRAKA